MTIHQLMKRLTKNPIDARLSFVHDGRIEVWQKIGPRLSLVDQIQIPSKEEMDKEFAKEAEDD